MRLLWLGLVFAQDGFTQLNSTIVNMLVPGFDGVWQRKCLLDFRLTAAWIDAGDCHLRVAGKHGKYTGWPELFRGLSGGDKIDFTVAGHGQERAHTTQPGFFQDFCVQRTADQNAPIFAFRLLSGVRIGIDEGDGFIAIGEQAGNEQAERVAAHNDGSRRFIGGDLQEFSDPLGGECLQKNREHNGEKDQCLDGVTTVDTTLRQRNGKERGYRRRNNTAWCNPTEKRFLSPAQVTVPGTAPDVERTYDKYQAEHGEYPAPTKRNHTCDRQIRGQQNK